MPLTDQNPPDALNPYAAPTADIQAGSSGVVPQEVMVALIGTRTWVRFISIVMRIACAMLLLFMAFGIYFVATEPKTDAKLVELPIKTLAFNANF